MTRRSIRTTACSRQPGRTTSTSSPRRRCPVGDIAFDLGTGSGVLTAVLLNRGVQRVVTTDNAPAALACAVDNFEQLGLIDRVELVAWHALPLWAGFADRLQSTLATGQGSDVAGSQRSTTRMAAMLREFLNGLADHLLPGGEGWLILSDLAEHLGLRTRAELLRQIETAGLRVLGRLERRALVRRAHATPRIRCISPARRKWSRCGGSGLPPDRGRAMKLSMLKTRPHRPRPRSPPRPMPPPLSIAPPPSRPWPASTTRLPPATSRSAAPRSTPIATPTRRPATRCSTSTCSTPRTRSTRSRRIWTKDQTAAYCKTAADTAKSLGMIL